MQSPSWGIAPNADEITQAYGCVDNPLEWPYPPCFPRRFHSGIDLGAVAGGATLCKKPVYATRAGTIARIGYPNGLGPQAVFLMADDGRCIIYGHLDSAAVRVGGQVTVGECLGFIGTKGNSTACHLHVEVRTDGPTQSPFNTIDPTPYLNEEGGDDLFTDADRQKLERIYAAIFDPVPSRPGSGLIDQIHQEIGATASNPLSKQIANLVLTAKQTTS